MTIAIDPECLFCRYVLNLAIALDELINTILGGAPHETISSRLGRAEENGSPIAHALCTAIATLFNRPNHCTDSIIPGQYDAIDSQEEILDLGEALSCSKEP